MCRRRQARLSIFSGAEISWPLQFVFTKSITCQLTCTDLPCRWRMAHAIKLPSANHVDAVDRCHTKKRSVHCCHLWSHITGLTLTITMCQTASFVALLVSFCIRFHAPTDVYVMPSQAIVCHSHPLHFSLYSTRYVELTIMSFGHPRLVGHQCGVVVVTPTNL